VVKLKRRKADQYRAKIRADLLKRLEGVKKPVIEIEQFKRDFDKYKEQGNSEWDNYKRVKSVISDLYTQIGYAKKGLPKLYATQKYRWPKWAEKLRPRAGERCKKVSPLFKAVYEELWAMTMTKAETKELTKRKGLPTFSASNKRKNETLVLVTPDIEALAAKLKTSPDNVRKVISRWTQKGGPLRKLGMTAPKNQGGKMIIAMGYRGVVRRVPFFTQERSEKWLRSVFFEKS